MPAINLTGLVGAGQRTYKSLADLFSSDLLTKYGRNTSMWGALSAPVEQMTPEQQQTLRNTAIIAGVGGPFVGPVNAAIDAGLMALPEMAGNLGQLVQTAASRRSGGRNLKDLTKTPVAQEPLNPPWYHGTKKTFVELDPAFSHPGSEHGKASYITDRKSEAAKYGAVRDVEFTGKVFPEASTLDLLLMKKVVNQLIADNPKRAAQIREAFEFVRTTGIETNDIALQEIGQRIGDFDARQRAINKALKELGYSAREYTEQSGAKTLAVFDKGALREAKKR